MPWTKASFGSYVNNVGQTKPYSVFHHVPENAKGLVFFFHGMTGRADIVERLESIVIPDELIDLGYGFVATDSQRRHDNLEENEKVQWFHEIEPNDSRTTDEYQRLRDLRDQFIVNSRITENTPIYAIGFSNGGEKTLPFAQDGRAQGWNVPAVAVLNSGIRPGTPANSVRL